MIKSTHTEIVQKQQTIFATLYKTFGTPLMKFIFKHIGAEQDAAEEIFGKTVAAAWKGFGTFEHKSQFFTWICRIALNKIADYYRSQINERSRFVAPILEDIANIEDKNLTPEENLVLLELRVSIRQCFDTLPVDTKKLLYLRYWEELTIKEIAREMNVSERSVECKIYRAKQLLKQIVYIKHPEIVENFISEN
jgi:RNA polymerase sigma factor (sigma-70 family)